MRRYCVKAATLIMCAILSASGLQGQGEKGKKRKEAEKHLSGMITDRQSVVVDRDLLDVYARIMRYQTAWQDILNQTYGNESTVDDYLTIAVRNVEEGELKDLQNYLKRIKQPSSDVLAIDRQTRCGVAAFDECELAYDARWAKEGAQYGLKFNTPNTGNVDYYITYDITVEYGGKSVTHGGVIVHYRNKNAGFMIYDGIIPQIDELVLDRMPLMADNRRMSRAFGDTRPKAKVRELPAVKVWSITPEEEEIIGWLPGDELELEDEWEQEDWPVLMMAAGGAQFTMNNPNFTTPWPPANLWGAVKPIDINPLSVKFTPVEKCVNNQNIWEPELLSVTLFIEKYAQLLWGVTEASIGNVTEKNYCAMIKILSSPVNPNAWVPFYVLDAVKAHENKHVSDYNVVFSSRLSILNDALKSKISIPRTSANNAQAALDIMLSNPLFAPTVSDWFTDSVKALTALGEKAAIDAEIPVLEKRVDILNKYAATQPWYKIGMCF